MTASAVALAVASSSGPAAHWQSVPHRAASGSASFPDDEADISEEMLRTIAGLSHVLKKIGYAFGYQCLGREGHRWSMTREVGERALCIAHILETQNASDELRCSQSTG